jgi:hypothetical protein
VETTTTSAAHEPAFHADDLEVANYRTLSGLAIVSLVFGLAAPVAYAFPVLLAIPLFGVAVSLIALRRIDTSDGALTGRGAAMIGLVLCVASVSATLGYAQMSRFLHVRQAEAFGRQWITLVCSGRLEQAFKLTVTGSRPEPPPQPGAPKPKETPFESFTGNAVIQQLSRAGAGAEVRLAETTSYDRMPGRQCYVTQRFTVTPAGGSRPTAPSSGSAVDALVTLQRSKRLGETSLHWLVSNFQDPAQAAQQVPRL